VEHATDDTGHVLGEVSHDLANRFHRFYYYAELLEGALGPDSEAAVELLDRARATVEDIESMTRAALAFVRPMDLHLLDIRLSDLVLSLRQHAGEHPVEVRGDERTGHARVEVDPSRISEALATLCRTAVDFLDEGAPLVVELVDGDPVGLRLALSAESEAATSGGLPLALTAKIARSHGGNLDLKGGRDASLTLWLPVSRREG
jgi:signal transduction histidine kinase